MSVKVMAQRINLPNVGERFCLRTARADSVTPKESSMALLTETALLASAGDVVLIIGERLMFEKKDALQGVFFKNGKSIRITKDLSVGDNKLEIQLPFDMKAGTYSILISSNLTGMKLRTGEMEEKFVVA